jgi:hypothetical protein
MKNITMRKIYGIGLLIAFFASKAISQEMTLYVIPPKAHINWKSPQSLFFSYAGSLLAHNKYEYSHPMGHVIIELRDSSHYAIAGMEARSKSDMAADVYRDGYGLGILFADIPGKLTEGKKNADDIAARCEGGDVTFIKFRLSSEAFLKLWTYLEDYKKYGFDKIYNGENKPREGKGAGCSAFATSFIEIATLLPAGELAKWQVMVNVPEKLIGGPKGNNTRVALYKVMLKRKWADTWHKYRTAVYYEPGLMYKWISAQADKPHTLPICNKEIRGNAKGVVIDCTRYALQPDPTWIKEERIPVVAAK